NDRLGGELELVAYINHAWVDGSRRALFAVEVTNLAFQAKFDDRDHMVDELRQAEIAHARFQIRHAVLQRAAPHQDLRIGRHDEKSVFLVQCRQTMIWWGPRS